MCDFAGMPYAIPAIASAAAKRLFGYRPKVPMISYRARRQIEHILSPESRMVEFGSGNSTRWFASRVSFLLSVEDLPDWYEHVQQQLEERRIANVKHVLRSAETYADLSDIEDGSLHFALVDGTDREGCVRAVVPKLKSDGWLYLDNTDKDMTSRMAIFDVLKRPCARLSVYGVDRSAAFQIFRRRIFSSNRECSQACKTL